MDNTSKANIQYVRECCQEIMGYLETSLEYEGTHQLNQALLVTQEIEARIKDIILKREK